MRKGLTLVGAALAALLLVTSSASAATLIGDYQFQGTRASSGPGPDLTALNDAGDYKTENVMGTTRQVYAFANGVGLGMAPTGLSGGNPPSHSVVMTFRLLDDTDYNRILDWSTGTSDNGIYDHDRKAIYYRPFPEGVESTNAVFGSNTYSTVTVTVSDSRTRVFVNGARVIDSAFRETFIGDSLRFFVDGSGGTTREESAGAVSCIRVYSGVLTGAEIAASGASPTCKLASIPTPAPSPTLVSPAGPTGQRDAALDQCRKKFKKALKKKRANDALSKPVKKHLRKKLRKCKRAANQLPV